MENQLNQEYDEEEVRKVVRQYSPEQQERMLYILDHYYYDAQQGNWKRKN